MRTLARTLAVVAVAAAAVPAAFAGRGAQPPKLTASVGPGFTISLKTAAGSAVTKLAPGSYAIVVNDRSPMHNFHLRGPGVNKSTAVPFTGTVTWRVTVAAGTYRFVCDPHAANMKGSFTAAAAKPAAAPAAEPAPAGDGGAAPAGGSDDGGYGY